MDRYTPEAANEVRSWIESTLGERIPAGDLLDALKDGVALCKYVMGDIFTVVEVLADRSQTRKSRPSSAWYPTQSLDYAFYSTGEHITVLDRMRKAATTIACP